MKIIARHKWVEGCIITESFDEDNISIRNFTATIKGFRNWKIYKGLINDEKVQQVKKMVDYIKKSIESGDEAIFCVKGYFIQ